MLGIETSCDETSAAVVEGGPRDPLERDRVADGAPRRVRRHRPRDRRAVPCRGVVRRPSARPL